MAATAQNLRRLAKLILFRRPSSPHEAEGPNFATPAATAGAHCHLQSAPFFNAIRK
jgi:hypothetical protein